MYLETTKNILHLNFLLEYWHLIENGKSEINVNFFINEVFFIQALLHPFHPSPSSCQNVVAKGDHGKCEGFWKGRDSSQIKDATEDGSEQDTHSNTVIDRSRQGPAHAEHALPNSESPKAALQRKSVRSTGTRSQAPKASKEIFSSLPSFHNDLLQDTPTIAPAEMAPTERKGAVTIQKEKDEPEEEELQELLSKLTDTFTLEMTSGKIFEITRDGDG